MTMTSELAERLNRWLNGEGIWLPKLVVESFAESEVRLSLQPREQAPGLAEAEEWLRREAHDEDVLDLPEKRATAIADELDRLRALLESASKELGDMVRILGGEP